MANLIMHDSFEPYYAGRETDEDKRSAPRPVKSPRRKSESEIVLPRQAQPVANRPGGLPERRRPVAH